MFTSIPEREEQVGKIAEFLNGLPDGAEASWLRIEAETGVKMDAGGRSLARQALRRVKRPYAAVRGVGVRMSSPTNAMGIMAGRFVRIDSAVKRADRTRAHLTDRHIEQMDDRDKGKMLTLAGFFGAVRAFAKEASVKILKS